MKGTCHYCQILINDDRNKISTIFLIFVTWERSCSVRNDSHRNGRTEITRLIVAFRNYAKS